MTPPDLRGFHGIDIGGSKIELVAFDAQMGEVHRERIATPGHDFQEFVQAIAAIVRRADAVLGAAAPVGIGLPGVVDSLTGRQLSSNVPALNGRLVTPALEEALHRPVVIGNDCQCFALSEAQGGAADGLPTMFGAILGTGAGGGYCSRGRLHRGFNGVAGEWGHWAAPAHLLSLYKLPVIACPCGRAGCMERYISGPGMSMLHRHFGGDGAAPMVVAARANTGDAIAAKTLSAHLDLLAHAMSSLVLALDPHAIVLGGGLSQLPHLYKQLPEAIKRHLFAGAQVPPILPPRFGDAGGARGAALLVHQHLKMSAP